MFSVKENCLAITVHNIKYKHTALNGVTAKFSPMPTSHVIMILIPLPIPKKLTDNEPNDPIRNPQFF